MFHPGIWDSGNGGGLQSRFSLLFSLPSAGRTLREVVQRLLVDSKLLLERTISSASAISKQLTGLLDGVRELHPNSSNNVFASFKSAVSKPS
ncbi:MAG: hypothetical protein O6944_04110, partial [Gammaproteobacteria bacterium]|nr:hypothetical protein [Gammaproteobacteria bacterium]